MIKNLRLSIVVLFGIVAGMILPAAVTNTLRVEKKHRDLLARLSDEQKHLVDVLALGSNEALWNFDTASTEKLVNAILENENVVGAHVFSGDGSAFVGKEKSDQHVGRRIQLTRPIVREGKSIGSAELVMTTAFVDGQMKNEVFIILLSSALQFVLSAALVYLILKLRVLMPVQRLVSQAEKLSRHELSDPFAWSSRDELGKLGSTLETARIELGSLFKTVEQKNMELEEINSTLEKKVAERTAQIAVILDHVQSGFLLIDKNLRVQTGYTRSCARLFGGHIQPGQSFVEVLRLSERDGDVFAILVEQVFKDILPERLTLSQLPKRFSVGASVVSLDGSCVRNALGTLEYLLFTVVDVTGLEKAEKESAHANLMLNILKQREAFSMFINDSMDALERMREDIASREIIALKEELHTLKGNSGTFGLIEVSEYVNGIEEEETFDPDIVTEIEKRFGLFFERNGEILQMHFQKKIDDVFEVKEEELTRLAHQVVEQRSVADAGGVVDAWAQMVRRKPARLFLWPIRDYAEGLAKRLGKVAKVRLEGQDILLDPKVTIPVIRNLTHVVRNSIDHGIEEPWERGDKPECATICVCVEDNTEAWNISVADDGRGIDPHKIADVALRKGIKDREQLKGMSNEEICQLIFHPTFSTAEDVTELSGRGVGMSSLRAAVEEVGGRIELKNSVGEGLRIDISIPKAA